MKSQTCCFTGHRHIPANECDELEKRLEQVLLQLIHQGVRYFGAGGARGFDTLSVLAVLKLKPRFPHIRLILVLPCKDQIKNWSEEDVKIYGQIYEQADKVVYTSERYHDGCTRKRNLHLVKNSGVCVAYMRRERSGAGQTVRFAAEHGLQIVRI